MFGFLRGLGGRLRFETPPVEPSGTELFPPVPTDLPRQLTADADATAEAIRNNDRALEEAIQDGDWKAIDKWLEARTRIREDRRPS